MRFSNVVAGGSVPFPAFMHERVYMAEFCDGVLPSYLERWQPTVDAMLNGRRARAYLMVDQRVVHQNAPHRRPGLHIDGCWLGSDHGHGSVNKHIPPRDPKRWPGLWEYRQHMTAGHGHGPGSQTLIIASDIIGCKAYEGWWNADEEFNGGDCSYVDVGNMDQTYLAPGVAYYGDAMSMLHESIPQLHTGPRTVVRINVENE